jgi:hypothetical protein
MAVAFELTTSCNLRWDVRAAYVLTTRPTECFSEELFRKTIDDQENSPLYPLFSQELYYIRNFWKWCMPPTENLHRYLPMLTI